MRITTSITEPLFLPQNGLASELRTGAWHTWDPATMPKSERHGQVQLQVRASQHVCPPADSAVAHL